MMLKGEYNSSFLLKDARIRMWRRDQSWFAMIVGGLGSGKSFSGMAICDYIMKGKFTIDNVFLRIEDFIKAIADGKLKKGDCVLIDEAGISFSSRESMTRKNRALSSLFQIMRYKNLGVVFTCPAVRLMDITGRDVINAIIQTEYINRKSGFVVCKYKINEIDSLMGKAYRKFARPRFKGKKMRLSRVRIWKPRADLIRAYKKLKKDFAESDGGLYTQISDMTITKPNGGPPEVDDKPILHCKKCSHTWPYKGKAKRTRCPSCYAYVVVEKPSGV